MGCTNSKTADDNLFSNHSEAGKDDNLLSNQAGKDDNAPSNHSETGKEDITTRNDQAPSNGDASADDSRPTTSHGDQLSDDEAVLSDFDDVNVNEVDELMFEELLSHNAFGGRQVEVEKDAILHRDFFNGKFKFVQPLFVCLLFHQGRPTAYLLGQRWEEFKGKLHSKIIISDLEGFFRRVWW